MDILKGLYVRLDPGRRLIQFSRQPLRSRGWRIRLTEVDGIPACTLRVGSGDVEMRLVTGLKNNDVPEEIVGMASPIGEVEDVFPGIEAFTTGLYRLPIQLGRESESMACGRLPSALKGRLALGDREGVLGAAFLQMMPATLAFPEGKLVMLT